MIKNETLQKEYILIEKMQEIERNVYDLEIMLDTVTVGLEAEKVEPQVVSCLNSIRICMKEIRCKTTDVWKEIEQNKKEC